MENKKVIELLKQMANAKEIGLNLTLVSTSSSINDIEFYGCDMFAVDTNHYNELMLTYSRSGLHLFQMVDNSSAPTLDKIEWEYKKTMYGPEGWNQYINGDDDETYEEPVPLMTEEEAKKKTKEKLINEWINKALGDIEHMEKRMVEILTKEENNRK